MDNRLKRDLVKFFKKMNKNNLALLKEDKSLIKDLEEIDDDELLIQEGLKQCEFILKYFTGEETAHNNKSKDKTSSNNQKEDKEKKEREKREKRKRKKRKRKKRKRRKSTKRKREKRERKKRERKKRKGKKSTKRKRRRGRRR